MACVASFVLCCDVALPWVFCRRRLVLVFFSSTKRRRRPLTRRRGWPLSVDRFADEAGCMAGISAAAIVRCEPCQSLRLFSPMHVRVFFVLCRYYGLCSCQSVSPTHKPKSAPHATLPSSMYACCDAVSQAASIPNRSERSQRKLEFAPAASSNQRRQQEQEQQQQYHAPPSQASSAGAGATAPSPHWDGGVAAATAGHPGGDSGAGASQRLRGSKPGASAQHAGRVVGPDTGRAELGNDTAAEKPATTLSAEVQVWAGALGFAFTEGRRLLFGNCPTTTSLLSVGVSFECRRF